MMDRQRMQPSTVLMNIDAISLFVYMHAENSIQTQDNRTEVEPMYHPDVEETIATLLEDGGCPRRCVSYTCFNQHAQTGIGHYLLLYTNTNAWKMGTPCYKLKNEYSEVSRVKCWSHLHAIVYIKIQRSFLVSLCDWCVKKNPQVCLILLDLRHIHPTLLKPTQATFIQPPPHAFTYLIITFSNAPSRNCLQICIENCHVMSL